MARESFRVTIPGSQGFDLAGIVDRPDDRPNAPLAVFSHCFTCNKDLKAIVRISRALADRGVAVLRYDMTGLGGSGGDFSRTSFTSNLDDLKAAVDFATSDIGPVAALIGHSFGGAASLAAAANSFVPQLSSVVTLATPSDTTHLADLLSRMNPQIESEGAGEVSIGGIRWTIRREMLDDFRTHDLPGLIAKVQSRVLVFHSPVDETVGFEHALRIQGLLQGSDSAIPASLAVLHGADHLLSKQHADLNYVTDTTAAFIHRNSIR